MSETMILRINRTLLVLGISGLTSGVGGFTSAIIAYTNLLSAVKSSQTQNAELREIIKPIVENMRNLQRDVDILKSEFKHLPGASKITADNLPTWRYQKD